MNKNNIKLRIIKLIFVFLCVFSKQLFAHQTSDSYLNIIKSQQQNYISWSIAVRDLEYAVGLDTNADSRITWQEILQRKPTIESYVLSRLLLYSVNAQQKQFCQINNNELLVDDKRDGAYLVFKLSSPCLKDLFAGLSYSSAEKHFYLDYQLLFDIDKNHRGLILIQVEDNIVTRVASPDNYTFNLQIKESPRAGVLSRYINQGIWHILIGLDHILFLLALLLPSVLVYKNKKWQQRENIRSCFMAILKIVTAFTLAHSITLSLSVLEVVQLSSKMIEIFIAITVLLTCLHTLKPVFQQSLWKLAFVFGLIHGFGFANVLLDLGLEKTALALSLFGFNIGVEIGQLFIVFVFLLFAALIHQYCWYRTVIFKGGISVTAIISCVWIFERTFNYKLLGF